MAQPPHILADLTAVPHGRPPADRPVALPRLRLFHGGCRWMLPAERCAASAPHWRCSWVDRPGALIEARGERFDQGSEQIFLIPPGPAYRQYFRAPLVQLYLSLLLPDLPEDGGLIRHPVGTTETVLLRRLVAAQAARRPPSPAEAADALALVGLILTSLPEEAYPRRIADPRIATAVEAIRRDPVGAPANPVLAATAGLSQGYFMRRFRALTGTTPQALRLRCRLEAAALDLRHGDPIKAVAPRYGWRSRQRFATAFRRHFGAAPAAWRRTLPR